MTSKKVALLPVALCMAAAALGAETPSLERLYTLPWVVGTTPEHPVWSPDSRHLAFLWADDGGNARDVWWVDVAGGTPERLTQTPKPVVTATEDPQAAHVAAAHAERDRGVRDVAFTGDGKRLVYTRAGQLYGVTPGQPASQRLDDVSPGVHDLAPVPRSSRVVYATGEGLSVIDTADTAKPARRLYAVPDDVSIDTLRVAPDGTRVAFLETDARPVPIRQLPDYLAEETRSVAIRRAFPGEPSEHYRVGVVSLEGGEIVWMDLEGAPHDLVFGLAWSPDGQRLLVDRSDLYIKHRWIRLLDATTGHGRTVYEETDPHNVTAEWWADFAPDGQSLYVVSDRTNDYHLWQVPLDGGPVRARTAGDWAVFDARVAPRAGGVIVTANRGRPENRLAFLLPFKSDELTPLAIEAGHHEPLPSPDGRWLADIASDDGTPPELYLRPLTLRAPASAPRRITQSPAPDYLHHPWAVARYVEFPNVHDGTVLHARLTLPVGFDPKRPYPAIIGSVYSNTAHNRWGGRVYHPTWALDQYLAAHGYVIMNVDISGSSGYGKAFRQRIREDYGGVDVEDLFSATRYLSSTGYVDPKRIGIWGSSYGGLLTTMSLLKHPGVYAAGVAGAPATSLFHAETGEMRTMMQPEGHLAQYRAASPFLYSENLKDPLLFIHGMRDDTVLFKDTMTLAERLILADKDFEIAVLPDAPHGWDNEELAQTRYAFRRLVAFFDRYLKPEATR